MAVLPYLHNDGSASIQKRDSKIRIYIIIAFFIYLAYVSAGYYLRNDPRAIAFLSDWVAFFINGLMTLCLFYGARQSMKVSRKIFIAWLMMAFGQLCFTVGDGLWAWFAIESFPSIADIAWVATYVFFIAGIMLLPSAEINLKERIKILLDTAIVIVTSSIFFWALILEPTIHQNLRSDPMTLTLILAYPVMDLILVFLVAEMLFRKLNFPGNEALKFLAMGAGIWIAADTVYLGQLLNGTYQPGEFLDSGWIAGYLLMGLAGIAQGEAVTKGAFNVTADIEVRYDRTGWSLYLPYLCAAGAFFMLVWSRSHYFAISFANLSFSVGIIIGLVFIRQIVLLNENAELYQEAQLEIAERMKTEEKVKGLNEDLEERVWLRTAQLEAANKDLVVARDKAEAAARAKSTFLANMSHEIRTPMNAVIGMASLLQGTYMKPEQRDFLETIQKSGNALLAIIEDILDYSKIDGDKLVLEKKPFDLPGCIEDSLDLVAVNASEKGLELAYLLEDGVPERIVGDCNRLKQVLINLLGNAVKFTDNGEVVMRVSSRACEEDDGKVELHFAVRDTGIGISPEDQKKLFQSFTQVDSSNARNYGGTGLGLAISRGIVERMGGDIWVESEVGKGSIFQIKFAAEVADVPADKLIDCTADPLEADDGSTAPQLRLANKRALIIDDNDSALEMLVRAIRSLGMVSKGALSLEEGMNILEKEAYDFVFLDAMLSEEEGHYMATDIKRGRYGKIRLVLLAPVGQGYRSKVVADGRLTKPVKSSQLPSFLEDLISHSSNGKALTKSSASLTNANKEARPLRILMAEDDLVNQKVALGMLKRLGYMADVAENGLEVLKALQEKPYDVVLMDVQMPKMDGLEATRRIRDSGLSTRIIAMTAHAMDGDRDECLQAGMDEYISKPIKMEELAKALESCSQGCTATG